MKDVKKVSKYDVVNVEDKFHRKSYLVVKTCRGKGNSLFYVIHIGRRKSSKSKDWDNQYLYVKADELPYLETLIRKSWFFSSTLKSYTDFVTADKIDNKNVVLGGVA